MAGEYEDRLAQVWEEEGLFSRDIDGQLIRLEPATRSDYDLDITITIDGQEITVKKATPTTDSQGNIVNDEDGRTIPRDTTILDAAQQLFVHSRGEANPIPTLCHAEHMRPVGVCRVCCVEVYRERNGELIPGGRLIPACHHPVQPGMIVHTVNSPDAERSERVRSAVSLLTEMLANDHLPEDNASESETAERAATNRPEQRNELRQLNDRFGGGSRLPQPKPEHARGQDDSSPLIAINHDACILCERCIRGCNEVKENHVIGRTGKGYTARIAFDLDDPMQQSSCVSCGECMVSCPTDALTFRQPIASQWHEDLVQQAGYHPVTADELQQHALFSGIPYKWLQWNAASLVRREVKPGDVLCWLGDYGSTAFLLNRGEFGFWFRQGAEATKNSRGNWLTRMVRSVRGRSFSSSDPKHRIQPTGEPDVIQTPEDLIVGEMTCLSFYPRTATIVAMTEGEIYELRRNVVYMLQRNATSRTQLDRVYRERALRRQLDGGAFFQDLNEDERNACAEFLRDRVELIRVDPGQTIFRQGERADAMYIIRLGFVKVAQTHQGQERVLRYLGPDTHFGEYGLLSEQELRQLDLPNLPAGTTGRRTATCEALDDVELVRIQAHDFRVLLKRFSKLRDQLQAPPAPDIPTDPTQLPGGPLDQFLDQGLFNAQRLLVLDLESCTRCDECVRACADTHGGVTRLVREGLRFDKFLVASACRSCLDPYCMVGCPVDAIHRESSLEINIESHCIGCGLCAQNCPYGNINMVGEETSGRAMVQQKATTCDLCKSVGVDASNPLDEVSCVYACPHNAAFRMSGEDLYQGVARRLSQ